MNNIRPVFSKALLDDLMHLWDWQAPIDMVLHCPACGLQHIDEPERNEGKCRCGVSPLGDCNCACHGMKWTNPPHRSHLCHNPECGHIWRPADVPTNGVQAVKTKGKADSPITERDLLQSIAKVGAEMINMTTTVRGRDEWPIIPALWHECMVERDKAQGEIKAQRLRAQEQAR